MKIKSAFLVLITLISAGETILYAADDLDVMFFEYKYMIQSNENIKLNNGTSEDFTANQYNISTMAKIPVYTSEPKCPVRVIASFRYDLIHSDSQDTGTGDIELNSIETLHVIKMGIGSYIPLSLKSGMFFQLSGSIHTDFNKPEELDWRDIVTSGNLIFSHRFNRLSIQFGITSSSNLGIPMILPLIGLTWKPFDWLVYKLTLLYETSLWFNYKIFQTGIYTRITGYQFRLMRNDQVNNFSVSQSTVETGLGIRVNIWDKVYLYSDLGMHPYRKTTIYDKSNNERAKISYSNSIRNSFFVKVGVSYSAI